MCGPSITVRRGIENRHMERKQSHVKITQIKTYQVDLPLHEGNYSWSEGKSVDVFDSTVVEITTDAGSNAMEHALIQLTLVT